MLMFLACGVPNVKFGVFEKASNKKLSIIVSQKSEYIWTFSEELWYALVTNFLRELSCHQQ
jgi:hypothetical protein